MRHDPSITSESDLPPDVQPSDQVLQDYRQRYGLSIDPFDEDPYFPLFTGGYRRELLDEVIHCCEFGAGIPVVLGERGVGKTRIAYALFEALGDSRTCFIAALPTLDGPSLIAEIAEHFGVDESASTTANYLDALRNFGESQGGEGSALVIDDAHHFDDQTLMVLLELLQGRGPGEPGLQVVLFGDLTLITRLHELEGSHQLPITDFYLERFTLGETVDYLNFRMEMADYLGTEMFTETLVESWWQQAQGQLPVIHRNAQLHLLEAVLPSLSTGSRPFPILHIVAIAALGGAVLMTLLYQSDRAEAPAEVQRIPISLQSPPIATSLTPPQSANIEPGTTIDVDDMLSVPVDSLPDVAAEETERVAEVLPPPIAASRSEPPQTETPPPPQPTVTKEAVVAAEAPVAQPAPTPAPAPITAARRLSGDEETLLSWRSTDFTLQLLGVSTEKAARDYIVGQSNRNDLLMFKTVRQGKSWYVVVAGRYDTSVAAKNAINNLPQEQVKAGPWVRDLRVIQREIQR